MIERSHLAIIKAVKEQGSLTAAAKQLHLTQSALSHAIKKLEQQLSLSIWVKEGRKLDFTQAGEQLLNLAHRVLPQLEYSEQLLEKMARGEKGQLRIGMECHPCYRWLLKAVSPFLQQCPEMEIDVLQRFQFGGMAALFSYDIDMLVTPDPLFKPGLCYHPVFDYEQVLVVAESHPLSSLDVIKPEHLIEETLFTYPVEVERLDIFKHFLTPAQCSPKRHKVIETTDILLQMIAAGRGVTAIPDWLALEYQQRMPLSIHSLGEKGVKKVIHLGVRESDEALPFIQAFIALAKQVSA